MELYNKRQSTNFYNLINTFFNNEKCFWPYLWINLYNNNELFKLWGLIDKGTYSRSELLNFLIKIANVHNKSVDNGLNSLLSTFEYTPIGSDLKIGIVTREKNKRFVKKEGGYPFDPYVVLYALYKFANKKVDYLIDIEQIENEIYSPQKVLVIESKYLKKVLLEIDEPDLLKTDLKDNRLIFKLNPIFHPYEILKRYIKKENI